MQELEGKDSDTKERQMPSLGINIMVQEHVQGALSQWLGDNIERIGFKDQVCPLLSYGTWTSDIISLSIKHPYLSNDENSSNYP